MLMEVENIYNVFEIMCPNFICYRIFSFLKRAECYLHDFFYRLLFSVNSCQSYIDQMVHYII